jgi:hypothetical protein
MYKMGRWVWLLLLILLVLLALLLAGAAAVNLLGGSITTGGAESDDFPYLHRDLPAPAAMFAALQSKPQDEPYPDGEAAISRLWPKDLYASDAISSHYSEIVRARCRFGAKVSPREAWDDPKTRTAVEQVAQTKRGLTRTEALREGLYDHTRWCNFYNPAFCLWIYRKLTKILNSSADKIRILDPSAGWGDRLIAACAFKAAQYHAFDPNTELREAYDQILDEFAPSRDSKRFTVTTSRFESANVAGSYDIVHTSPPFFDLEDYPAEGGKTAKLHPKYADWLTEFYQPYLAKAWQALRPGGCFCLYIDDIHGAPLARDSKRILQELGATYLTKYGFRQILDWPQLTGGGRSSSRKGKSKKGKPSPIRPAYVWIKPLQVAALPTLPSPRVAKARKAGDLVIDTLNLTHHLAKSGAIADSGGLGSQILKAIDHATPLLRKHHAGRLYFILKDPDGREDNHTKGSFGELANRLDIYIHIAEVDRGAGDPNESENWQKLGEKNHTHQKMGRDDFYMGYMAWKRGCAVLTEDRMRDFEKLKTEVRPFRVRAFDAWRAPQVERLFPGAQEYKQIRTPPAIRFAEYDL